MKQLIEILNESILSDDDDLNNREFSPSIKLVNDKKQVDFLTKRKLTLDIFEEFLSQLFSKFDWGKDVKSSVWEINADEDVMNGDPSPYDRVWFINIYLSHSDYNKRKINLCFYYNFDDKSFKHFAGDSYYENYKTLFNVNPIIYKLNNSKRIKKLKKLQPLFNQSY